MELDPVTKEPIWAFPFDQLEEGMSFFIPTVKPNRMIDIVNERARAAKVKVRAFTTVKDNCLGVRVWRVP
jgi:hypothetical protein